MFYRQLSVEVPVRVPRCYYADSDSAGERYIMLLEHLEDSGCTFRNASTRYSLDYVRKVLASFARLHAAYWESPRFRKDMDWLAPPVQHPIAKDLVGMALEQHADSMPAVFSSLGRLYQTHADVIHQLWNQGPHTLIHGDVHDGNLFSAGDRPGFLDWALVARGNPMRDVGYFLAGTLEVEDQRAHRLELLGYYHTQLAVQGVSAPPLEEFYRYYQWHAAYVWVGAAVTLAMGDAWQPVSYVRKTLERLHFAIEELDTVAALETAIGRGA
jgi:Ser/Thr protein kinase RdoA (MazF antagonist)